MAGARAISKKRRELSSLPPPPPCNARRQRKFTPFSQKHWLVSFLVGLRTYQHSCISSTTDLSSRRRPLSHCTADKAKASNCASGTVTVEDLWTLHSSRVTFAVTTLMRVATTTGRLTDCLLRLQCRRRLNYAPIYEPRRHVFTPPT